MSEKNKNINPYLEKLLKQRQKSDLSIDQLLEGILSKNNQVLAKAISLVESSLSKHRTLSMDLLGACIEKPQKSIKIGVSGTPGVGKSTFIESFGMLLISKGYSVAVLAVDPSSRRTGGSILGDKTRMTRLSIDESAFIRPSAAGKTLGGVARTTRETITICEAAGYDFILIETVGVGQSETLVSSMVDMYIVLLLPGGGDELQGIKRGIVELADLIVINKSDGDNKVKAQISQRAYNNGLHYFSSSSVGWIPKAVTASALNNKGIEEIYEDIISFIEMAKESGIYISKQESQNVFWYEQSIKANLEDFLFLNQDVYQYYIEFKKNVSKGKITPFQAAYDLMKLL